MSSPWHKFTHQYTELDTAANQDTHTQYHTVSYLDTQPYPLTYLLAFTHGSRWYFPANHDPCPSRHYHRTSRINPYPIRPGFIAYAVFPLCANLCRGYSLEYSDYSYHCFPHD